MSEPTYLYQLDASAGRVWKDTARSVAATLQDDEVKGLTDPIGGFNASNVYSPGGPTLDLSVANGYPGLKFLTQRNLSLGNPSGLNLAHQPFTVWTTFKTGPAVTDIALLSKWTTGSNLLLYLNAGYFKSRNVWQSSKQFKPYGTYTVRYSFDPQRYSEMPAVSTEMVSVGGDRLSINQDADLPQWEPSAEWLIGAWDSILGTGAWWLLDQRLCLGIPPQDQIDTVDNLLAAKFQARTDLMLAGIGDSNLYGYSTTNPATNNALYLAGQSLGIPDAQVINLAYSGQYAWQAARDILIQAVDVRRSTMQRCVAVVQVGANDRFVDFTSIGQTFNTVTKLCLDLAGYNIEPIPCTWLPRGGGQIETDRQTYAGWIRAFCTAHKFSCGDVAANATIGAANANTNLTNFNSDGTHLNDVGQIVQAGVLVPAIRASRPAPTKQYLLQSGANLYALQA